jgi:hypothetical protein
MQQLAQHYETRKRKVSGRDCCSPFPLDSAIPLYNLRLANSQLNVMPPLIATVWPVI